MNATDANDARARFVAEHQAQSPTLPGAKQAWLQQMRAAGIDAFAKLGFPNTRDEAWRYTEVRPITAKNFSLAEHPFTPSAEQLKAWRGDHAGGQLVLVNGVYREDLSAPPDDAGIEVRGLADVLQTTPSILAKLLGKLQLQSQTGDGFAELNRAFIRDGAVILANENARATKPIEILHIGGGDCVAAQPRVIVCAQAASRLSVIERFVSPPDAVTFSNGVSEVMLAEDSEVDYYMVQTAAGKAYQVAQLDARLAAKSRFSCRTVTFGGALVRNNLRVELAAPDAHCDLFGLSVLGARQHVDNHTGVVHAAANCTSREWYKAVLQDRSRGVFHGRIQVAQDAQKTDAEQTNNALLLSPHAEIDAKPQLEIYADDVKCSHGATVGRLDDDALFYLRARGVAEVDARALLTFAFADDILREVAIEPLRAALELQLRRALHDPRGVA